MKLGTKIKEGDGRAKAARGVGGSEPLVSQGNDKKLRNEEKLCRIFDFALLSRAERSIIIPGRLGEQHYS